MTRQADLESDQRLPYLTLCVPKNDLCALSDDVFSLHLFYLYNMFSILSDIFICSVMFCLTVDSSSVRGE